MREDPAPDAPPPPTHGGASARDGERHGLVILRFEPEGTTLYRCRCDADVTVTPLDEGGWGSWLCERSGSVLMVFADHGQLDLGLIRDEEAGDVEPDDYVIGEWARACGKMLEHRRRST